MPQIANGASMLSMMIEALVNIAKNRINLDLTNIADVTNQVLYEKGVKDAKPKKARTYM